MTLKIKKRNLLLLAYNFPPFGGVSSVRVASLCKYLPEYGWNPIVYTCDWNEENCRQHDPEFAKDLEGFVAQRCEMRGGTQVPIPKNRKLMIVQELRNWHRFHRTGKKMVRELVQKNSIDVIFATFPPGPAHWLASWASRNFKIPWVADFRDILEQQNRIKKVFSLVSSIEKSRLKSCCGVVTVSQPLKDSLQQRHDKPILVLPNGFDSDEMVRLTQKSDSLERSDKFKILYTGLVYPLGSAARISPKILFEAIDNLLDANLISKSDLEIEFIGSKLEALKPHMNGFQSEQCVTCIPWLTRSAIYQKQATATVLLSLASKDLPGIVTGKIFEYLHARRPIISVPRDKDAVSDLLEKTGGGYSATTTKELSDLISDLYDRWRSNSLDLKINEQTLEHYNWKTATGKLTRFIEQLV